MRMTDKETESLFFDYLKYFRVPSSVKLPRMSMKHSNDTIGIRTRDLPACGAVAQPTVPPRAPIYIYIYFHSAVSISCSIYIYIYIYIYCRKWKQHCENTQKLAPRSTVFLRNYPVLSWSRNSPHFVEPEGSLPRLHEPAICPYPKPDQFSPCPPIPLPEDPF